MNHPLPNQVNVAAQVTLGALPNICMLLILVTVGVYLWGQYHINAKLANVQAEAIDAAIVEGREFHHREGRLIRRIATKVGVPQDEIDKIIPESTLIDVAPSPDIQDRAKQVWLAF